MTQYLHRRSGLVGGTRGHTRRGRRSRQRGTGSLASWLGERDVGSRVDCGGKERRNEGRGGRPDRIILKRTFRSELEERHSFRANPIA